MPLKTHIECVCVCPTMCSRCNVHKREREIERECLLYAKGSERENV